MMIIMIAFSFSFLLLSISLPYSLSSPPTYDKAFHIDCGGSTQSTDKFNTTWLADRFFSAGATGLVSEPLRFQNLHEKTVRFFPISSGKKNCYTIPNLPIGSRFYIRTFTVYDNYDGKSHSPSFEVSVEGTLVFSWHSPWPEDVSRSGAYSDLIAFISDGEADICFYSIATDPPVIASLELVQIDAAAYDAALIGNSSILVNYGRLTSGSGQWGPGFSNDTDLFFRSWQSDAEFRSENSVGIKSVSAVKRVINTDRSPNFFPEKLYSTAVVANGKGGLEYELQVDAKMDYLLWFHFAEIDVSVNRAGKRVFDIVVNKINVTRIDIYKEVGGFAAYDWHYVVKNLSDTILSVMFVPVVGSPLICGVENYAIVPADLKTVPDQVIAMRALKESLKVPERMGWNGDPCAPTSWDAWEGVTCHTNKGESALVVSQMIIQLVGDSSQYLLQYMSPNFFTFFGSRNFVLVSISPSDLGSQGLKGYISEEISLLSNLVSLNLSSNTLGGTLPLGLGQKSLVKLDLSSNKFSGSIPESLTSSKLQLVLLNDNSLEGQVPEEIYSIGVHGGAIDLSGNKGLCGVPSLPDCPLFWKNGGLSKNGKIAIGISCLVFVCLLLLLIYICCIRRGRNDYDFGLPHELTSLAAKRNRYHRQKSLMTLEMESQHAKGFIPSYSSN